MSKIVILDSALAAPHIMSDALARLGTMDPATAKWAESVDVLPLIKEAAMNAVKSMKDKGVIVDSTIEDFRGHRVSDVDGRSFLATLKTDNFLSGMALIMEKDGTIKFAADDYGRVSEIRRLQEMYKNAFLQECIKMFLEIMGYKFTVTASPVKNSGNRDAMQGVYIQAEK